MSFFDLRSGAQLIAGILFFILGIFILLTDFENNKILVGNTKLLFGGILSLYGLVRIGRIYFQWKSFKNHHDEY